MSSASRSGRGRLKVFLSYAAGAGKTYRMLEEAQGLKKEGADIVIGYFEPHGRADTIAKVEGLETIPRKQMDYRGAAFEEMDTAAILRRSPRICAVDEFPHTNVPGSQRKKRWEDVMVLLDAGIDVLTTMNLQHLESLNDEIWKISGIRVRETVPDWVIKQAGEVVMVDVTPEALINRLRRGVVYSPDKATQALENFFKEQTLVALRELALRQAAHEVELRQKETQRAAERILIHITHEPTAAMLIRRGRRVADYLRADCFAVFVSRTDDRSELSPAEKNSVEKHLNFARNLHIETRVLQGQSAAATLVEFARQHQITQIFLMRPRSKWKLLPGMSVVSQVLRLATHTQITVVAERKKK